MGIKRKLSGVAARGRQRCLRNVTGLVGLAVLGLLVGYKLGRDSKPDLEKQASQFTVVPCSSAMHPLAQRRSGFSLFGGARASCRAARRSPPPLTGPATPQVLHGVAALVAGGKAFARWGNG